MVGATAIPAEFKHDAVAAASPSENSVYGKFLTSREPLRTIMKNNPSWEFVKPGSKLEFGTGAKYYDTTVARKHPYWCQFNLPTATKDINQMRQDIREWGFCLIEDALSPDQLATCRKRVLDQMHGERAAGIAQLTPSGQNINTLVNKGECFVKCIEHNPEGVQAGPMIEQLLTETLGPGWLCHSFLANGANPGGAPQFLHQDQGSASPIQTPEAPLLVSTLFVMDDVNEVNGGTLVIPGTHRTSDFSKPMPPPINLEAKAGTVMLFDGRLWHGTGANRSDKVRYVMTMSSIKPWMRSQENWIVSVKPEVLKNASAKLLHRFGFQALTYGGTCEGFGMGSTGRVGDTSGALLGFRNAIDNGTYVRVGELSSASSQDELHKDFTVRKAMEAHSLNAKKQRSKL